MKTDGEDIANGCFSILQAAKVRALQTAYRKQQAANPRDDAPSAGQIRGLGLLDASDEEKAIHPAKVVPKLSGNL